MDQENKINNNELPLRVLNQLLTDSNESVTVTEVSDIEDELQENATETNQR